MKGFHMTNNALKKILIVEDSKTEAQLIFEALKEHSFSLEIAYSAKDALKKIETFNPEMIISDVIMPDMDGFDLCRMVRKKHNNKIIIILLTALSRTMDVINGLEAGADCFLSKPCPNAYLLDRINNAFVLHEKEATYDDTDDQLPIMVDDTIQHVNANRKNIVELILTTYDAAVLKNKVLVETHEQLKKINNDLSAITEKQPQQENIEINHKAQLESMRLQDAEIICQLAKSIATDFRGMLELIKTNLNEFYKATKPRIEFNYSDVLKDTVMTSELLTEKLSDFSKQSLAGSSNINLKDLVFDIKHEIEKISGNTTEIIIDLPTVLPAMLFDKEYLLNSLVSICDSLIQGYGKIKKFIVHVSQNTISKLDTPIVPPGNYILLSMTCHFKDETKNSLLDEEKDSTMNLEINLLRAFMNNLKGYLLFEYDNKNIISIRLYFPNKEKVSENSLS